MNRSIPFALSLALLGPVALAEDAAKSGQSDQAQSQSQSDTGAAAASDAAATATDDQAQAAAGKQSGQQQDPTQMFIKDMYSHNLYEVQLATWIQKNAQDDQIKQLAQMLIKDHTQANQQLKQVAQSAGAQVEEKLDPVHQAKLQKFQQLPQSEVARKFANDQVAGHMVAVLELTYQAKNAQDQQVKQFATKMLPQMQQHLDHVTKIATQQAGGSGAGGEAQPASSREPAEQSGQQPGQSPDAAGGSDAGGAGASQSK